MRWFTLLISVAAMTPAAARAQGTITYFWDINDMANKIIAVLKHPPLASTLRQHGSFEVAKMSWTDAARACVQVYDQAVGAMNGRSSGNVTDRVSIGFRR